MAAYTLTAVAAYLLVGSVLVAMLFGAFLRIRARNQEHRFRASILPFVLTSHFVLSLATVAATDFYNDRLAQHDTQHCVEASAKALAQGGKAVPSCNLMWMKAQRAQGNTGMIAYVAMTCALLVAAFQFYRVRFESSRHVQA